uniref:Uncharacterized protein n=1 Tax=Knipowitschia caucasica TaxID=637954 RepID=A0AAV2JAT3_KNICA
MSVFPPMPNCFKSGRSKEKSEETSSHYSQDLEVLFEDLKKRSKYDGYQKALEVMQSAPIEQQEAFATIIHTLLPPGGRRIQYFSVV